MPPRSSPCWPAEMATPSTSMWAIGPAIASTSTPATAAKLSPCMAPAARWGSSSTAGTRPSRACVGWWPPWAPATTCSMPPACAMWPSRSVVAMAMTSSAAATAGAACGATPATTCCGWAVLMPAPLSMACTAMAPSRPGWAWGAAGPLKGAMAMTSSPVVAVTTAFAAAAATTNCSAAPAMTACSGAPVPIRSRARPATMSFGAMTATTVSRGETAATPTPTPTTTATTRSTTRVAIQFSTWPPWLPAPRSAFRGAAPRCCKTARRAGPVLPALRRCAWAGATMVYG